MKKILLFLVACVMVLTTSCSGDPKSVYEKIQSNQELTQDDYTVIIKYNSEALLSNPLMDEKAMSDVSDMDEVEKKMDEWKKKYEYFEEFGKALNAADVDKLNDKNKKLIEDLNKKLGTDFSESE